MEVKEFTVGITRLLTKEESGRSDDWFKCSIKAQLSEGEDIEQKIIEVKERIETTFKMMFHKSEEPKKDLKQLVIDTPEWKRVIARLETDMTVEKLANYYTWGKAEQDYFDKYFKK